MNQRPTIITSVAAGVVLLLVFGGLLLRYSKLGDRSDRATVESPYSGVARERPKPVPAVPQPKLDEDAKGGVFDFSDRVLRMLIAAMLANDTALRNEAVLRFANDEAYRRFLASLAGRGVRLLGQSDALRSVRLGFDSYRDLAGALGDLDDSETAADANYIVRIPSTPGTRDSPGPGAGAVAFGNGALNWLGIRGDNASWGEGVKVAILDSGVQEHPAFGDKVIREWDMVFDAQGEPLPVDPDVGHGTAVASIIGGADPRLPGVAPAAELLSFRILDNSGITSSFTLAEAIVEATDAGADVINVSLGSTGDSLLVRDAVAYAQDRGALIVAAAGNEGSDQVSYPAAIEGVVAVAASDARGEHLEFSNAGESLVEGGLAAPGYGVLSAWPDERVYDFSGTSASAPFVSGAVAATMSQNEGMSAQEAYQMLLATSNEAGAPMADPEFGSGNLNVGRAMDSNTPGITDVAVASYYYDPVAAEEAGGQRQAQVVVENRGTTAARNITVDIEGGFGDRSYTVDYIEPGDIKVINLPIDLSGAGDDGMMPVSAEARLNPNVNGSDRNLNDNRLTKDLQVRIPEPVVPEELPGVAPEFEG